MRAKPRPHAANQQDVFSTPPRNARGSTTSLQSPQRRRTCPPRRQVEFQLPCYRRSAHRRIGTSVGDLRESPIPRHTTAPKPSQQRSHPCDPQNPTLTFLRNQTNTHPVHQRTTHQHAIPALRHSNPVHEKHLYPDLQNTGTMQLPCRIARCFSQAFAPSNQTVRPPCFHEDTRRRRARQPDFRSSQTIQ